MRRTIVVLSILVAACGGGGGGNPDAGDDGDDGDDSPDAPEAADAPTTADADTTPDADTTADADTSPDANTAVDAASAPDGGTTMAAGDTCALATVIAAPGTISAQTTMGATNDYDNPMCTTYMAPGEDTVYAITVPAAEVLTATVTPLADEDIAIYLVTPLASCTSPLPMCVAGDDNGIEGDAETVAYTNNTNAPETVYVVVDSYYAMPVTFDLTTSIAPIPAGESCSNAIPITAPATVMDTSATANDYAPATACTGWPTVGLERVYSTSIPAGATLTANLMPGGTEDISIYFLAADQCVATPTCLVGTDIGGSGGAETLMYTNTGTAPVDIYVVVDSYVTAPFTYTLTLSAM